jgi:serine/threonine-protein kinase
MSEAFKLAPHEWALLRSLLDEALALPLARRAAWLDQLDESRAQGLKPRLQSLLANATDDDPATGVRLLQTLPKVETGQFAPLPGSATEKPGDAIGPYRLIRELGSGGMGSVWLAERTDMLQGRQVALKLPHGAWKRAGLAERMAREREILATLEHPNIARLYDAGVADDGQPWLALEYVQGERIDAHCRRLALPVRERVALALQVVRAVAHAHGRLVVHRDLKPGNVLVTEPGADKASQGQVKLLDFGIAKLMEQGSAEATVLTQAVGGAFTPEYASPEQVRGEPLTTTSDVYSLGVLLFELLAEVRPYRPASRSRAALEEAISQGALARPSALAPSERRRALRGDLDTIVLKALQREPGRRYATADALADDLQRYLEQRPVLAQPDRALYRTAKFVRRNGLAVAAAGITSAALLIGAALALWQARAAQQQEQRAKAVSEFITGVFADASPWIGPQTKPAAADLLERARERLQARRDDPPQTRLELLLALGIGFTGVQERDQAERTLREAIALADAKGLAADHPLRVAARLRLADVFVDGGRPKDLAAAIEGLVPLLEQDPKRHAHELATALLREVQVANDQGRYADMEVKARRALEVTRRHLPAEHVSALRAQLMVGNALENQRKLDHASIETARAYEMAQALYRDQPLHPQLTDTRFIHARVLQSLGRWREALPLMEQCIAETRQVFGERSARLAVMLRTSTTSLLAAGRPDDALVAIDHAWRIMREQYRPDSVHLAYARVARGSIFAALHRHDEAFASYDEAWQALRTALGAEAPYVLYVQSLRLGVQAQTGAAAPALRDMTWVAERHKALGLPDRARIGLELASVQRLAGQAEAALATLEEIAEQARRPGDRRRLHQERGQALLAAGRAGEAQAELERAIALMDAALPMTPTRAALEQELARAHIASGRAAQAAQAVPLLQAVAAYWHSRPDGRASAREAERWLARARNAASNGR